MKITETSFFNILRAGLWDEKVNCSVDSDELQDVLKLAKQQSVLGIVVNVILKNTDLMNYLPEGQEDKLRKVVMLNYGAYSKLSSSLMKLIDVLDSGGIKPVLLKGHGLAQYYPVPELRQCGDIDIYVGPDQFDEAKHILLPLSSLKGRPHETKKHVEVRFGNTIVELHRVSAFHPEPIMDEIYQTYAHEGLDTCTGTYALGSKTIAIPSDTFNAFYVFYHLWRHFLTEGVGLRQLCDWMMLLHTRNKCIDVESLRQMVADMKLMKPWKSFAAIIVRYLGISPDEVPFYEEGYSRIAERILKRILKEGNFGHERSYYKSRKKNYLWMKVHAFWCHLERYFAVSLLFPSHSFNQFFYMARYGIKVFFKDIIHKPLNL